MNNRQTRTVVLFALLLAGAATPFIVDEPFPLQGRSQGFDLGAGPPGFTFERSFAMAV